MKLKTQCDKLGGTNKKGKCVIPVGKESDVEKLRIVIPYKKSPKGRKYIGKATFVSKDLAKDRARNLKVMGTKAWVEGRTVYLK